MKYCSECGKPIKKEAKFCPYCGTAAGVRGCIRRGNEDWRGCGRNSSNGRGGNRRGGGRIYPGNARACMKACGLRWLAGWSGAWLRVRANGNGKIQEAIQMRLGSAVKVARNEVFENCQHIVVLSR